MNGHFAPEPERDSSNFDFRTVALFTMMATRPDLLHEYLVDGAAKRDDGTPVALHDPTRWVTLRRLGFPPELLAVFLYLFERKDVRAALRITQKLFRTMVANVNYCDDTCPDDECSAGLVAYCKQSSQRLNRPGVEVEAEEEVLVHA
jgi:hypothetical protein